MDSERGLFASLRNVFQRTAAIAGVIGTVGGLISDVLQPLLPLANYLFLGALTAAIILLLLAGLAQMSRRWALPAAVICLFLGVFCGVLKVLQDRNDEGQERGILASNIPALAAMQEQLGLIQKDVAEIKETTGRIEEKTDAVLVKLEDMSEAFSGLAAQGGIIPEPKTPEQFYHNARLYELNGDYGNARRAYLGYFKFDLPYLDPHLRFLQFLKVQEGPAGARESYQYIAQSAKGLPAQVASALLWDKDLRVEKLDGLREENPDSAAIAYLLSQDFSQIRLGRQSLADKRREKELLEAFQSQDDSGNLVSVILDQELVSEWREDATNRLKALQPTAAALENPLVVTWMHSNSGWKGSVQIAEQVAEIFWKKPGTSDFQSTGKSQARNISTGEFMPNMSISLPDGTPKQEIEFQYTNINGGTVGPLKALFD
ncbi:MAG: hypothetical protein AAGJ31_15925, partial [Verrucomicrobiota bacterium]